MVKSCEACVRAMPAVREFTGNGRVFRAYQWHVRLAGLQREFGRV